MNIMSLKATPLSYFKCSTINSANIEGMRTCDVEETLAQFDVESTSFVLL